MSPRPKIRQISVSRSSALINSGFNAFMFDRRTDGLKMWAIGVLENQNRSVSEAVR